MVEVILHIGDGKCGSTAIQSSLSEARKDLSDRGVLYLPDDLSMNHFFYSTLLGNRVRGNTEEARRRALRNLEDVAAAARDLSPDYVLFSAESFFGAEPAGLTQVLESSGLRIDGVHVVAYVRHPVGMYLSLNQQKLKASHVIHRPDDYERNLAAPLERWGEFERCRSVSAGLFDRKFLKGGSVVQDFEGILRSITQRPLPLRDLTVHTSLSAEQMVVLQRFRRDFLKDLDGRPNRRSKRLILFFEDMNTAGAGFSAPRVSAAAAGTIVERNRHHVERLDRLVPWLGMARSYDDGPAGTYGKGSAESAGDAGEAWTTGCIGDVLEWVDRAMVERLIELIPGYNPELGSRMDRRSLEALEAVGGGAGVVKAYATYLEREGCLQAAQALEPAGA